jgi:phospholipid-binding lipoprotein MlaA
MQKLKLVFFILISFFITTNIVTTYSYANVVKGKCYEVYDPNEKLNRTFTTFNFILYRAIIYPPVALYNKATPKWTQNRVNNFFDHLRLPLTLINNLLQKDRDGASDTIGRFLVNTIFGLGGLFDVASKFDIPHKPQNFSSTLAHYGMAYGSYSVTPFFGPSTTRGTIGQLVDFITDPMHWVLLGFYDELYVVPLYDIVTGIDTISRYNDMVIEYTGSSIDPYTKIRSTYIQYLANKNPHCKDSQAIDYSLEE